MPNATTLSVNLAVTATETVPGQAGDISPPSGNTLVHNGFNQFLNNLNSASAAWPVSFCSYQKYQLSSGTLNIDLTNLVGQLDASGSTVVNGTGKKVRVIIINAPVGNGNIITITPGVSNGYNLFGTSSSKATGPGGTHAEWFANNAPTVGSGAKILTLTGTGSSDYLNIGFVFG
jgi:hypothetical protein